MSGKPKELIALDEYYKEQPVSRELFEEWFNKTIEKARRQSDFPLICIFSRISEEGKKDE